MVDRIANDNEARKDGTSYGNDHEKDKILDQLLLEQLLSDLPENERNLIELRYYHDKTQTEVAKVMGISQVQVSRLEKRVLMKMRKKAACE